MSIITAGARLSFEERTSPPQPLATLVDNLSEAGLEEAAILDGTGLDGPDLAMPGTLVSARQFVQACRNAVRHGAPAQTPFIVGSRLGLPALGLYGYALLGRPTLRDLHHVALKYHRYTAPFVALSFRERDGEAVWQIHQVADLAPDDPLYRFLLEMQFARLLAVCRDALGSQFRFSEASCRYRRPEDAALYDRHLQCPATFDRPENELRCAVSLLDEAIGPRSSDTVALAETLRERVMERLGRTDGASARVLRLLLQLPGRFDDMDTIAARLHTTSRTLRRRLQAENTSFQQLLAGVRCELAKEYLQSTRMSTEDIADGLGFSDAANFRHAFRRWTGKTTSAFRR